MTLPTIGRVWLTECQRCANSEISFEPDPVRARVELAELGWDNECCPACNGARRIEALFDKNRIGVRRYSLEENATATVVDAAEPQAEDGAA